ncbi:MarR family transcriptional regulator [Paenibacillus sp. 1011MAR3C5]|uniref:MarR family winged helix-turn-helix transcriptional regulator n=1 Tax=Paenibacillus sp. 1011MAR3C5 TaxID=1675787 RepID=UPI000E6BDEA4|nr:MarR family transcriptional regulator [Paenibacillus sp. 1011MAR3C5]RJE86044.1 MarR family transcriptional regulator [Paenibacillus sp. 1011MAR3C5]
MEQDQCLLKSLIHRYEIANFIVERGLHVKVKDLMPEELTVDQFKTLRFLRHNENSTASELAQYFCVGKSSITAIITRLSDKGLIDRVPDDDDRRVIHLRLTEEGERISGLLEERVQNVLSDIIVHFDEKEAIAFIETFEKLAIAVKAL